MSMESYTQQYKRSPFLLFLDWAYSIQTKENGGIILYDLSGYRSLSSSALQMILQEINILAINRKERIIGGGQGPDKIM